MYREGGRRHGAVIWGDHHVGTQRRHFGTLLLWSVRIPLYVGGVGVTLAGLAIGSVPFLVVGVSAVVAGLLVRLTGLLVLDARLRRWARAEIGEDLTLPTRAQRVQLIRLALEVGNPDGYEPAYRLACQVWAQKRRSDLESNDRDSLMSA